MSLFNTVVEPHPISPLLVRAINWAQQDDPNQTYPLQGRLRYVWIDKDLNIKLLLKDGPSSWSEEQEAIMNQIKTHETFVSVEVFDRDPVYIIATFKPIMETTYDRLFPVDKLILQLSTLDDLSISTGLESIFTHPFDIFDRKMEEMQSAGKMTAKMERLGENIKSMIEGVEAETELNTMLSESGVESIKTPSLKIYTVDSEGNLESKGD